MFVTPGKPWADTIDCSYRKEHTAKDLVGLKSYLAAGTIVSVVEEKVSVCQHWVKGKGLLGGPAVGLCSLWEAARDGDDLRPGSSSVPAPGLAASLSRRCFHGLSMLIQKNLKSRRGRQDRGRRRTVPR